MQVKKIFEVSVRTTGSETATLVLCPYTLGKGIDLDETGSNQMYSIPLNQTDAMLATLVRDLAKWTAMLVMQETAAECGKIDSQVAKAGKKTS